MSFTTILGILVGVGLFVGSIFISTDNYFVFISLSSALMVIGGTLAATFIAYEARYVLLALKLIFKIFRAPIENAFNRNLVPVSILKNMAGAAPAFGMIGTLVGLVIMLDKMADDPTQLGAGLAIALITTLYGIVAARFFFMPAASKIQQSEEIMRFRNYLIAEGLIMLADRKGPRAIQDKMNSFLDPAIHFNIDKSAK